MIKKALFPLLCCLLLVTMSQAQTDCSDYQLLRENALYELVSYNAKDKPTGRIVYNVMNLDRTGGKLEATVHSQVFDEKGQLASEGDFKIGCESGSMWMDMNSLMNRQSTNEGQPDMEMTMEGDRMLYPNNLQAGQKLQDGTMTMEMKNKGDGQRMMTMVMKLTGRTVEGQESIRVPAGTYDSYKIRYNTEMENRAMGMKMPGMRLETVEYYVPKVGMVRSETYRNGKLLSYTVLSKIE